LSDAQARYKQNKSLPQEGEPFQISHLADARLNIS
jgi:hypothetical protein